MDRREQVTEEIATSLIGLASALAEHDAARAAGWLGTPFLAQPLPGSLGPEVEVRPGFRSAPLAVGAAKIADPAAWAQGLVEWQRSFARVDDVRFDVLEANPSSDGSESPVRLRLRIQGVLGDGGRRALTAELTGTMRAQADRWLLATAEVVAGGVLSCAKPPFVEVGEAAGVQKVVRPVPSEEMKTDWQGACALDFDQDGWMDLFVASQPKNHLYRNRGDGTFEDVARAWGVEVPVGGTGALALDFDDDGRDDIFLCSATQPLRLFKNDGKRFVDVSRRAGVERTCSAASAAAADYDGDGRLDVFVACYKPAKEIGPDSWHRVSNGGPSLLFRNKGDGTFEEVAAQAGVAAPHFSFAAAWADYDEDGKPDLAVANDYGDKALYHNLGGGRFEEVAAKLGVVDTGNGMGADWGDYDGDGHLDLFFANMTSHAGDRLMKQLVMGTPAGDTARVLSLLKGNALFRWDGKSFQDVRAEAGIADSGWAWGGGFFDADGDGRLDLFVANGMISGLDRRDTDSIYWTHVAASSLPVPKALREIPSNRMYTERHHGQVLRAAWSFAGFQRDSLFLNAGLGRFVDVSPVSGCDGVRDGRSAVFADFDNDGRPDIFVHETMGSRHQLYANQSAPPASFVSLTLEGVKGNRAAVGARVAATLDAPKQVLVRHVAAGSGYASSGDRRILIPVPAGARLAGLEILWPGGAVQKLGPLSPGHFRVREGEAPKPLGIKPARLGGALSVPPSSAGGVLSAGDRCPDLRADFIKSWSGGAVRLAGRASILVILEPSAKETAGEIQEMEKLGFGPKAKFPVCGLLTGPAPDTLASTIPLGVAREVFLARLFGRGPRQVPLALLVDPYGQITATRRGPGATRALVELVGAR